MLPAGAVDPIRAWLEELAADAPSRADIARRTLGGAVRALAHTVRAGAVAADAQHAAGQRLRTMVDGAYEAATVVKLSRQRRTARCCAARCWPGGRTLSEPGNFSAASRAE